jgi:hypothetical protein
LTETSSTIFPPAAEEKGMSDLIWALGLFLAGLLGLLFPWLLEHFRGRVKLSVDAQSLYLSLQDRFERRMSFSLLLTVLGLLWIITESL